MLNKLLKNMLLSACSVLTISSISFAGGPDQVLLPVTTMSAWYVSVGGGYAWSNEADIRVNHAPIGPASHFWTYTLNSYNDDLNNSPFFTLAVGRRINSWLLGEISSSYFGNFHYQRYLIDAVPSAPNFFRRFALNNFNLVFNLIVSSQQFSATWFGTVISPFIGVGVGPALNTVSDFHNTNNAGETLTYSANDAHVVSLAAQAEAGLSFALTQSTVMDVGYRYYYGGTFHTPTRFWSARDGGIISLRPWQGNINANLLFADVRFAA